MTSMTMAIKPYWKPEPKAPDKDWLAPLLKKSLWVSGTGWAIYGVFAFAFQDIDVIPGWLQSALVILGSALIVIGAEMNTAPTSVAVFRKLGAGKAHWLDVAALLLSFVGSIFSALLTFSARQTLLGEQGWRAWMLAKGPIFAGVATAADYYAATAELGLLSADYERDMETWLAGKAEWEQAQLPQLPAHVDDDQAWQPRTAPLALLASILGIELTDEMMDALSAADPSVQDYAELEVDPSWPTGDLDDLKVIIGRLNGQGATITRGQLEQEFIKMERQPPSLSTMKRYVKRVHKASRDAAHV